LHNVWLSNHVIKRAWPVFSGRNLVIHSLCGDGAG
jgi:hypothetical protein